MKKFIETLKNIWSIDELRNRIIFTLTLLLIYRVGCHVVLPGINPNDLQTGSNQSGLLGLFNMFAGGAFNNASIFALGIMPYISASIAMQLAQIAVPQLQKMSKEESGRKKNQPDYTLCNGSSNPVSGCRLYRLSPYSKRKRHHG